MWDVSPAQEMGTWVEAWISQLATLVCSQCSFLLEQGSSEWAGCHEEGHQGVCEAEPPDINKDVVIWMDAAPSDGMKSKVKFICFSIKFYTFVLCQWKDPQDGLNITSCDSTTLKGGKRSYSPFEAELADLHYALTTEDYYYWDPGGFRASMWKTRGLRS